MQKNITYRQFGAVGDGVTDDSAAIRRAHEEANRTGASVLGSAGDIYYIGVLEETIPVRTSVDWQGAKLIFDDSHIRYDDQKHRRVWVFTVLPDTAPEAIFVPEGMTLSRNQVNIGLHFSQACMLKIENETYKINRRYGVNENAGDSLHEYILVDEKGNVDPSTPIQYDYECVTAITAYTTDEKPLSMGNGSIETIATDPKKDDPDYDNQYHYFARGICVKRSNVTLHDIDHTKTGEDKAYLMDRNGDGKIEIYGADKPFGVPYIGTFCFRECVGVLMRDCSVQGHQAYNFFMPDGARNECGSYEMSSMGCIGLTYRNLRQKENPETGEVITNSTMYHGTMGSYYCRNLLMENCYLDRFDSHQGVHNATIRDSVLGFGILVIGGGTLRIENVTRLSGNTFIYLREDYNSIFDGDITVRNCKAGAGITSLIEATWRSFFNGLPHCIGRRIDVDGLEVENTAFSIFAMRGNLEGALEDAVNPLLLPEEITLRNMNIVPRIAQRAEHEQVFPNVKFTAEQSKE
ncbi:MAG: hypothetical protein E7329_03230 [Clostridiales bacterium]|nr:hypothetical protein [Clostridiales bacterium]